MIVEYKCNNIECYVRHVGAVLDGLPKTTRREEERRGEQKIDQPHT